MVNFGDESTNTSDYEIEDYIVGIPGTTTAVAGTADSITAYQEVTTASKKCKCALYSADRTTLIGQTDERTIGVSKGWNTYVFSGSKPSLLANTTYYIVQWGDVGSGNFTEWEDGNGVFQTYDSHSYGATFPADISADSGYDNTTVSIYCTYSAAAAGTNMQMNIGDTWKEIASAKINIGDAWKAVASARINIGDSWKTIF